MLKLKFLVLALLLSTGFFPGSRLVSQESDISRQLPAVEKLSDQELLKELYSGQYQNAHAAMNELKRRAPFAPETLEMFLMRLRREPLPALVEVLKKSGRHHFDEIIAFYQKSKPWQRKELVQIIAWHREGVRFLLKQYFLSDQLSQSYIESILKESDSALGFQMIEPLLLSEDRQKQLFALRLMERQRYTKNKELSALFNLLLHPDREIATKAAYNLRLPNNHRGLHHTKHFFLGQLQNKNPYLRLRAMQFLSLYHHQKIEFYRAFAEIAEKENGLIKSYAEAALQKTGAVHLYSQKKEAKKYLLSKMQSENFHAREGALGFYCYNFHGESDFFKPLISYIKRHANSSRFWGCVYRRHIPEADLDKIIRYTIFNMPMPVHYNINSVYVLYHRLSPESLRFFDKYSEISKETAKEALSHQNPKARLCALVLYLHWHSSGDERTSLLIPALDKAVFDENRHVAYFAAEKRTGLHHIKPVPEKVIQQLVRWYKERDPVVVHSSSWLQRVGYFTEKDIEALFEQPPTINYSGRDNAIITLSKLKEDTTAHIWKRLKGDYSDQRYYPLLKQAQNIYPDLFQWIDSTDHPETSYIRLINAVLPSASEATFLIEHFSHPRLGKYAAYALTLLEIKLKKTIASKNDWLKLARQSDMFSKSLAAHNIAQVDNVLTPGLHVATLYLFYGSYQHSSRYQIDASFYQKYNSPEYNREHFQLLGHQDPYVRNGAVQMLYMNAGYVSNYPVDVPHRPLTMEVGAKEIKALEALLDDPNLRTRGFAAALLFRYRKFHQAWKTEKYFPYLKYSIALFAEEIAPEFIHAYYGHPELQVSMLAQCLDLKDAYIVQTCLFYLQNAGVSVKSTTPKLIQLARKHPEDFIRTFAAKTLAIIAAKEDLDINDFILSLLRDKEIEKTANAAQAIYYFADKAKAIFLEIKIIFLEIQNEIELTEDSGEKKKLAALRTHFYYIFMNMPYDKELTTKALDHYKQTINFDLNESYWLALRGYPDLFMKEAP